MVDTLLNVQTTILPLSLPTEIQVGPSLIPGNKLWAFYFWEISNSIPICCYWFEGESDTTVVIETKKKVGWGASRKCSSKREIQEKVWALLTLVFDVVVWESVVWKWGSCLVTMRKALCYIKHDSRKMKRAWTLSDIITPLDRRCQAQARGDFTLAALTGSLQNDDSCLIKMNPPTLFVKGDLCFYLVTV